jgi:hypothetical protein
MRLEEEGIKVKKLVKRNKGQGAVDEGMLMRFF